MGENMELNKKEIEEIQEKLLMVYRFISQNNTFNKFYCQGLDVNYCSNHNESMVSKLMELDHSEELLKNCIIELEDMKTPEEPLNPENFQEFVLNQDWNLLLKKYGMKTLEDVRKLDLEILLELL
jgi:hypothetical protein